MNPISLIPEPWLPLVKIGGLVALIALPFGIQTFRLHLANNSLADAKQELSIVEQKLGKAEAIRDEVLAKNTTYEARINSQNQAIASLAAQGQAKNEAADTVAKAILSRPMPRMPVVSGKPAEAMNSFIDAVLDRE